MNEIVYIILSIVGILSIPIILLLIWWLLCVCQKTIESIIITINFIRECRRNFIKDTKNYKDDIAKLAKEVAEEDLMREEERKGLKRLVWDRMVLWMHNHYIATAIIASFVVAIIFLVITFIPKGYATDNERVVLAFAGVLATFVVLTNHAQSAERIRELEKMLNDTKTKLNETIDNQKKQNEELLQAKINESTSQHMLRTFKFVDACRDQNSYSVSKNILDTAQEDEKNRTSKNYKIRLTDGNEVNATISISKDNIQFVRLDTYAAIPHELIKSINGDDCDIQKVCTIVLTLRQLYYNNEKQ